MDLSMVRAAVRRRWRALLLLFLLGPALALADWAGTPTQYQASTTVIFALEGATTVRDVVDGGTYVQQVVPSYADLARTPVVLEGVVKTLDLDARPVDLAKQITVDVTSRSVLAKITATSDTGPDAAALANAVAGQLATAVDRLSRGSGPSALPIRVTTVSPAEAPSAPFAPSSRRSAVLGLLGGLLLAALYLYVREAVASTVRTREDVADITDRPVVGSPVHDPRARTRVLPVDTHPHITRAESFRILRTNLLPRLGDDRRVLAVVSGRTGEGRTSTAANLAVSMAHTGRRVLLVDADLRQPRLAEVFGVDDRRGLSSVLIGTADVASVLHTWSPSKWDAHGLDLLPAGPPSDNASELLASPRMAGLLDHVSSRYDLVILDTPALLEVTDAALVAAQAEATVVVVDSRSTQGRDLAEVMDRLAMAGATVLGVVLNNVPDERHRASRGRVAREDMVTEEARGVFGEPARPATAGPRTVTVTPRGPGAPATAGERDASASTSNIELAEIRRQVATIRALAPQLAQRRSPDRAAEPDEES
jgi:capsular exopolysaccharide synthesis family protein